MNILVERQYVIETLPIRKSRCKKYAKQTPIQSYRTAKEVIKDSGRDIERISMLELIKREQNISKGVLVDDNTLWYRGKQAVKKREDSKGQAYYVGETKQKAYKASEVCTTSFESDDLIKTLRTVLAVNNITAKGLFEKHYAGKGDDSMPCMTEMIEIKTHWRVVVNNEIFPIDVTMPSIKCKVIRTWATELSPDYFTRKKTKTKVTFNKVEDGSMFINAEFKLCNDKYMEIKKEYIPNTQGLILDEYRYDFFFDGDCRKKVRDILNDVTKLVTNLNNI